MLRKSLPLLTLAHFVECDMHETNGHYSLTQCHKAPHIFHPSFSGFIMNPSRCYEVGFLIAPVLEQERQYVIRCFELLADILKWDVAGISDASLLKSEVVGFRQKTRNAVMGWPGGPISTSELCYFGVLPVGFPSDSLRFASSSGDRIV